MDDDKQILEEYIQILSCPKNTAESASAALEAVVFGESAKKTSETDAYELTTVTQGQEGVKLIREAKENGSPFTLAFIDVRMPPGWDGAETASRIRKIDQDIEIVLVTAYSDIDREEIVKMVGRPEKLLYLKKPFDPDEIKQLALSLTQKWDLEKALKNACQELEKQVEERREAEKIVSASLREKEVLLQELHHRVKNNLQVILSLIHMASYKNENSQILEFSRDVQSKIEAMVLVHNQLYAKENLKKIRIAEYITELYEKVDILFSTKTVESTFMVEDISLRLNKAIPLGLVLNEVFSNIFKHAFVDQQSGHVDITLQKIDSNRVRVSISDNGKGIPDDFIIEDSLTMGMKLIKGIVVEQMCGRLEVESDNGATIIMEFGV